MANEIQLMGNQKFQVQMVQMVEKGIAESGSKFNDYQRNCIINAMAALIPLCKTNKIDLNDLDQNTLKVALQNVGFLELNFAATPAEAYFDIRRVDGKQVVTIKPQGAGNEKLTRKFGVNVKELKSCILVREGDEYTLPGFDGEKMTPFTWKPHSLDAKVILVVYPLLKQDGTYEYLMATRESIKPNLIAQVRQNNLYTFKLEPEKSFSEVDTKKRDDFYQEVNDAFEKLTVDEILADPRWRKELTPTYTSGGSVEAMVIRKMKNNALKNYPREYANQYQADAANSMWEDRDDSLFEKKVIDVNPVEKVEKEIAEEPKGDAVPDFEINENGEVEKEKVDEKKSHEQPKQTSGESKPSPKRDTYEEEI